MDTLHNVEGSEQGFTGGHFLATMSQLDALPVKYKKVLLWNRIMPVWLSDWASYSPEELDAAAQEMERGLTYSVYGPEHPQA